MPLDEPVKVTLSRDLLNDIDRHETDLSKFITEAVLHELDRRRHEELRRSLEMLHPESVDLSEQGFNAWSQALPEDNAEELVDIHAGQPVRWVADRGWLQETE